MVDDALEFRWNCTDDAGAGCKSPSSEVLDMESFASGGLLTIPAGTLPSGTWQTHVICRDLSNEKMFESDFGRPLWFGQI